MRLLFCILVFAASGFAQQYGLVGSSSGVIHALIEELPSHDPVCSANSEGVKIFNQEKCIAALDLVSCGTVSPDARTLCSSGLVAIRIVLEGSPPPGPTPPVAGTNVPTQSCDAPQGVTRIMFRITTNVCLAGEFIVVGDVAKVQEDQLLTDLAKRIVDSRAAQPTPISDKSFESVVTGAWSDGKLKVKRPHAAVCDSPTWMPWC